MRIPHYSRYDNWQKIPELVNHDKRLRRLGLTDRFIRNYVYKYDPANAADVIFVKDSPWLTAAKILRPGVVSGFIAAAALITIEESYTYIKYGYTSWTNNH